MDQKAIFKANVNNARQIEQFLQALIDQTIQLTNIQDAASKKDTKL
jgi:hypothetical protein